MYKKTELGQNRPSLNESLINQQITMSIIRNDPFFAELSDFDSFFTPIIRRPHSNKEGGNVLRGQSSLFRPS